MNGHRLGIPRRNWPYAAGLVQDILQFWTSCLLHRLGRVSIEVKCLAIYVVEVLDI